MIRFYLFFLILIFHGHSADALAQVNPYPNRPITIMIPMGPGGTSDALGRIISPLLSEKLGQPVIVENRPGANGLIGEEYFSKVKSDGYTIMLGSGSASINLWLQSLSYDPRKSFVPVTMMSTLPMALIVNNKLGIQSMKEFIEYAKKAPTPINYGHWGDGSVAQLDAEILKTEAGIEMSGIPYKASPQVLNDTIGGQIEVSFVGAMAAAQHINGGKIQVLAVTSPTRTMVLPNTPTMTELGYPKVEVEAWFGFFVPRGTPENIKNMLSQALINIVQQSDVKAKLESQGFRVVGNTPDQFSKFYLSDIEKNGRAIKLISTNK
ncbi:tripartite tricarboxylate transporter substrate binding protein [Polynucleobacter kasalickyi]|uniref:Tripartite-type tricarboxylate transporter, receptor component TctC n=1 Tax=Polynucleobacter kasalickyi TaxID=1938817 RepID=A0A1W2BM93_9BURK|nr:tripartite tricarboxylate transporter substrate binding protein [Polynucleobacter kasalickyi]SMC74010.1 Tripartite-type tricarboxylate transporter, receptor component TctC [Polynucleobacter kasalickyi]